MNYFLKINVNNEGRNSVCSITVEAAQGFLAML